jgi:hypothetical protein
MAAVEDQEEETFDLEEFKTLRQEILQKVEATNRLEVFAVTGAAAVYAWLATRDHAVVRIVWFIPVLFPVLGFWRAKKIGDQMTIVGGYLELIERRRRQKELSGANGELAGRDVHGWESYVHRDTVWNKFRDRAGLYFWISFICLTIVLPFFLPSSDRN